MRVVAFDLREAVAVDFNPNAWNFYVDTEEFDVVVPVAPVGTSDRLRIAVEILIMPFGVDGVFVREFIDLWLELGREQILDTLLLPMARTRRRSPRIW